jgi:hypothetical protein
VGISDDIDATLAQLEGLRGRAEARKAGDFAKLASIVAGIDQVIPELVDEYEPMEPLPRRPDDSRRPSPAPGGFEEPPIQDGRPGHQFSGALRAKLVREALDKGTGW